MSQNFTIAIPMAGFGTRLRPHTWSKPKPLIPLAGQTVLDHVLAQFNTLPGLEQADWVFIVGPNQQSQVEAHLQTFHPDLDYHIVVQEIMRGQADALYLARSHLHGPMLMTFSDTLISTDLAFLARTDLDGIAWVKPVPDPRRFGVAEVNGDGFVTKLVEKPQDISNNLALVGFYYFCSGEALMGAIEEQMQRKVQLKGEYYLADTINILLERGARFKTREVEVWLDAGTRTSLLETNAYLLDHGHAHLPAPANLDGVTIMPPVHIPDDASIGAGSSLGPHVTLGRNVRIERSILRECIVEEGALISDSVLHNSHIGRNSHVKGARGILSIGDDSQVEL
jgi:glucose-1-phosphate thymidylyltransferase